MKRTGMESNPLHVISPIKVSASSEASDSTPEDALVEGLISRMLGILRALDRQDQLETSDEFSGWLETFSQDEEGAKAAARELVLRALRAISDRINYRILQQTSNMESRPVSEVMQILGLGRVEAVERIHDLVQVGALSQDLVSGSVQVTLLGAALAGMVERTSELAVKELLDRLSGNLS